MCGWSDNVSGINHYHVEVFKMTADVDDSKLVEMRDPVYVTDIKPPHHSFQYSATKSGHYSHITASSIRHLQVRSLKPILSIEKNMFIMTFVFTMIFTMPYGHSLFRIIDSSGTCSYHTNSIYVISVSTLRWNNS